MQQPEQRLDDPKSKRRQHDLWPGERALLAKENTMAPERYIDPRSAGRSADSVSKRGFFIHAAETAACISLPT